MPKDTSSQPSTSGTVTGEELEKRCIKYAIAGLVGCGLEAQDAWTNFCRSQGSGSAGGYPSIGLMGWEGIDGGNGDRILEKLGFSQYAGQSYDAICAAGGDQQIIQKLGSDEGHKIQLQFAGEMLADYLGTFKSHGWSVNPDGKSTVFILMWAPTNVGCIAERLEARNGNGLDLEGIYQWFKDNWMQAGGAANVDGYNNRNDKTYEYCKGLDMSKDADIDVIIDMAAAAASNKSGLKKGACATDRGFKVIHTLVEKVPDKTFCEPVYPDYITVSDTMPAWALTMQQDLEAAAGKDPTGEIVKDGDAPEKAPNGMHYSEEDIKTRMEANNETREQAIEALTKEPKYNTPVADNGDGTFTVTGKPESGDADNGKKSQ